MPPRLHHYRDGQEDQLGALGFALNALVVWNAQYLDDAIAELRATGHQITDEDLERLSPLQHEHIKMLGHFLFTLPPRARRRATPPATRARRAGLAYVPVPLLPGGQITLFIYNPGETVGSADGAARSRRGGRPPD